LKPDKRLTLEYVVGCIVFAMEELDHMAEHEAARLLERAARSLIAKDQAAAKRGSRGERGAEPRPN
jgi:hypothetical protein